MISVVHIVYMRKMRNGYESLVGKPEGKTPCQGLRYRWEDRYVVILKKQHMRVWIGFSWL
jgi:hypothetical protein